MAAKREGRWLCPSCGCENLGRYNACEESCGAARPDGVEFYLPENSPIITDKTLLADAASGQDWYCDHCTGANPGAKDGHPLIACAHCAHPRTRDDKTHRVSTSAAGATLRTAEAASAAARAKKIAKTTKRRTDRINKATFTSGGSSRPQTQRLKTLLFVGLGALLIAGLIAITLSIVVPTQTMEARITALEWDRSISVEQLTTKREQGWSIPAGGRMQSRDWRYKETKQIVTGTTETSSVCGHKDLGNGYFEDIPCVETTYRDEVVNDWFYTYDIDAWDRVRTKRASGQTQHVYWPQVELSRLERAGSRTENYRAVIERADGQTQVKGYNLETWLSLSRGQNVDLSLNRWGRVIGVEVSAPK